MQPNDLAHEDWQLATHHFRQGDDGAAEKICREILAELPTHIGAMHLLGVICGKTGRLPEAIQTLQRAAQLEPSSWEITLHLSYALAQAGALARALQGFERVRELSPSNFDAIGMVGNLSLQLGRYSEAAECLMEAADLRPRVAEVQMLKGQALYRIGRFAEAEAALRRAGEIKPELSESAVFLGDCLAAMGKDREAEAVYRAGLGRDPRFHAGLTRLLQNAGRFDEAVEVARDSAGSRAPSGEAVRLLAREQTSKGDINGAIQRLRESLPRLSANTIDMAGAMFDLARLQFMTGDATGAMTTASQARAALAPEGRPKYSRGKHYLKMLERLAVWPNDEAAAHWIDTSSDEGVGAVVGVMGARSDILSDALREIDSFSVTGGASTFVGLGGEIPGHRLGSQVYPAMIDAIDDQAIEQVRATYLDQIGSAGAKMRIDAHGHNLDHLAALSRIVPGYRAVAVIRNPADAVAEAMIEQPIADESALVLTSVADITTGVMMQHRVLEHISRIPGIGLLVVDADDLQDDPEGVLKSVCEFFGKAIPGDAIARGAARVRVRAQERLPKGAGERIQHELAPVAGMLASVGGIRLGSQ